MLRASETIQRTHTGRQRRGNEDSAYARAPVFVVADGMGGAQAGEVASQVAVQTFEQGLPDEGSPEERLAEATQEANRRIHEMSRSQEQLAGMGSTLTAALLDGGHLAIAHVGDSRAYLFREGQLSMLTKDHSLVGELLEKGKLTEEEALEHPQRSIITRALGPEPEVEVDTWSYTVRGGDVVLLCSDGLTSMIAERQVREILLAAGTLHEAADRLIDAANDAGGRDNITVVLFRVEEVGEAFDGGPGTDQPTMIASAAPRRSTTATTATTATAEPRAVTRRAPLARTQGVEPPPRAERHFGLLGKTVAATFATMFVILLVGGGGYLASRQLYFIGTNGQGMVTVYRGFPYVLPFGIPMYETFYVSGVPASQVPVDRRGTLLNHDLRSQGAATKLVNALERGDISP